MKICCFGASVTEQKEGYAEHLKTLISEKDTIIKKGYGGEHLFPAGPCHIDEVIKEKPDLCLVDWFSTACRRQDQNLIDSINTIIYKIIEINCKIVFLFFPITKTERIGYNNFVKEYLNKMNVSYIDLTERFDNLNLLLRDGVHTTAEGGKLYAKEIYKEIKKRNIKTPNQIEKNKFYSLKLIKVNKIVNKKIKLKGNATILSFKLIIGPQSGYVNLLENDKKILLWDEWCHYERKTTNISNVKVSNQLTIEVLNEKVDYSTCRREFNPENVKYNLNIIEIYYYDGNIKIVECD